MNRFRLLDLFCCAGGAGEGYRRAGFDVTGVDIEPQPNNPHRFIRCDAFEYLVSHGHEYDAIHASPPCHDYSRVTGRNRKANGAKGTAWMLERTISLLSERQVPWVVENVEGAKWPQNVFRVMLCGSMFGLNVRRHRWFASNVAMLVPSCNHTSQRPRFRTLDSGRAGALACVVGVHGHTNYAGEFEIRSRAMGIDWMKNNELSQAIPPDYTFLIGRQLMRELGVKN